MSNNGTIKNATFPLQLLYRSKNKYKNISDLTNFIIIVTQAAIYLFSYTPIGCRLEI